MHRVGNIRGRDPGKLFSNQVKQEIMTEKYTIQPSGDQILMVEKATNTALYVKEVVKKLNEHAEMIEALKWAYEVLSRVDHSYAERNTPEGQMKLSNMRFILKEIS